MRLDELYEDEGDYGSSDDEFQPNTTGNVPLEWYSKMGAPAQSAK